MVSLFRGRPHRREPHAWGTYLGEQRWEIEGSIYTGSVIVAGGGAPLEGFSYLVSFGCPDTRRQPMVIIREAPGRGREVEPPEILEILEWAMTGGRPGGQWSLLLPEESEIDAMSSTVVPVTLPTGVSDVRTTPAHQYRFGVTSGRAWLYRVAWGSSTITGLNVAAGSLAGNPLGLALREVEGDVIAYLTANSFQLVAYSWSSESVLWVCDAPSGGIWRDTILVVGSKLYVGLATEGRSVVRIDAEAGEIDWEQALDRSSVPAYPVDTDFRYGPSLDLFSLRRLHGHAAWSVDYDLGGYAGIRGLIATGDRVVPATVLDHQVIALDAETGEEAWRVADETSYDDNETGEQRQTLYTPIAADGGKLLVAWTERGVRKSPVRLYGGDPITEAELDLRFVNYWDGDDMDAVHSATIGAGPGTPHPHITYGSLSSYATRTGRSNNYGGQSAAEADFAAACAAILDRTENPPDGWVPDEREARLATVYVDHGYDLLSLDDGSLLSRFRLSGHEGYLVDGGMQVIQSGSPTAKDKTTTPTKDWGDAWPLGFAHFSVIDPPEPADGGGYGLREGSRKLVCRLALHEGVWVAPRMVDPASEGPASNLDWENNQTLDHVLVKGWGISLYAPAGDYAIPNGEIQNGIGIPWGVSGDPPDTTRFWWRFYEVKITYFVIVQDYEGSEPISGQCVAYPRWDLTGGTIVDGKFVAGPALRNLFVGDGVPI